MACQEEGIKLFGATITMHDKQEGDKEDPKKEDPTIDKRPEKLIPCPRCKSMETKFCYFNNYNINQPRYFCKGCQRYWTAGGALRNVPVGAGRRKNKPPGLVGIDGYSEGCLYDGSGGAHLFELDGVVLEDWHLATTHGSFHHVFPVKRRRSGGSGGQTC